MSVESSAFSVVLAVMARCFFAGLIPAAILALPVLRVLVGLKSRQTISEYVPEHQAKEGTPTMGGLMVVGAMMVVLTWLTLVAGSETAVSSYTMVGGPSFAPFFVLLIGFATIGFIDDFVVPRMIPGKRGLGWKQKFGLEILVAIGAMLLAHRLSPVEIALAVFLILFFSNAYNFTDGLDGLAASVGICLLGGLAMLSLLIGGDHGETFTTAVALVGALVPFLFLNAPPAKVFMGDVGSLPIGALIGAMVAWMLLPQQGTGGVSRGPLSWASLAVLSLVMVAELVPVPLQIASVKLRKKKLFLMTPIHHGFEKRGWPETRIVWRFALIQLVLGAAAILIATGSEPDGVYTGLGSSGTDIVR